MRSFELPLLTKELAEQAVRKRTYVIRFVYTAILFGVGLWILYGKSGGRAQAPEGQGRVIFYALLDFQYWAVMIVIPATMAGAFAAEKERETMTLLLLTTMSPWSILFQKVLSRIIPILTYLTLSFPLLAAAYCYGGIQSSDLLGAFVLLPLSVLQIGAITLMASAYCRTTVEAFICSFMLIGLGALTAFPLLNLPASQLFPREHRNFSFEVAGAALSILCGGLLARYWLVSRAFVPSSNVLLQSFKRLDAWFTDWNRLTGGVILVKDGARFPAFQPIAWRETAKKSLGTFRYLFRVLVVLEILVFTVVAASRVDDRSNSAISWMQYGLWLLSVPMVAIHAASAVSAERARQTLDVLLTTPIEGEQILREKLAGVKRAVSVFAIPIFTTAVLQHWYRGYQWDFSYLLMTVLEVFVFFRCLVWLGMWMGLRNRSQLRAVLLTLGIVTLVCASPHVVLYSVREIVHWQLPQRSDLLAIVSPAYLITLIENARNRELLDLGLSPKLSPLLEMQQWTAQGMLYLAALPIFVLYLLVGRALQRVCLKNADHWLGRVRQQPDDIPSEDDLLRESLDRVSSVTPVDAAANA